jgi:3-methyladenine DNA glycosylase/8-oxoguanine DNA glycosylase
VSETRDGAVSATGAVSPDGDVSATGAVSPDGDVSATGAVSPDGAVTTTGGALTTTPGDKPTARVTFSPGVEIRVEVTPPWPFRLPRYNSLDGLTRCRNGVLHRLLHIEEQPVLVRIAQLSSGNVLFGASHPEAIERMRRALWIDLDMRPFYDRFKHDPWIGAAVRRHPTLRPLGRPFAFEALTAAITEQLIESRRAAEIQRRIHAAFGRASSEHRLNDAASAQAIAGAAPAQLESCDLTGRRAIALSRVARQVAMGRIDLEDREPAVQEDAWRRLQAIPEIGSWTTEMVALVGQQRVDQVPHGDLGFIKLAGRLASGGDPRARGSEDDVRALFARFGEWKGLAASYALRSAGTSRNALLV